MSDFESVKRLVEGKPAWSNDYGKKRDRSRKTSPGFRRDDKPKKALASAGASDLGQHWYDLGEASGFKFPYDSNYFALALQQRIADDEEIQTFVAAGKHDQVDRWVRKMIEIWWGHESSGGYQTGEVKSRNAKEYFLGTDWDDLRDYTRSSLRAAYLKEHGRRVPQPLYPAQREYQERLQEIHTRSVIERYLEDVRGAEKPVVKVDEDARKRLRSWRDKRRSK